MQPTNYNRTARSLHAAARAAERTLDANWAAASATTAASVQRADARAAELRAAYAARRQLQQPRGVFARIAAVFAGGLR